MLPSIVDPPLAPVTAVSLKSWEILIATRKVARLFQESSALDVLLAPRVAQTFAHYKTNGSLKRNELSEGIV